MAENSNNKAIAVGAGVAVLGALFAAFGAKKKSANSASLAGVSKKSCNCGR